MTLMFRALILAMLFAAVVFPRAAAEQALGVLHIKVVLVDTQGKATPIPNHTLLISDNPSSAPPRLIRTALDGTADVRLRPGNYTVESDRPVAFQGKAYEWTQTVDIVAGRDAVLELTSANAEAVPVTSAATSAAPPTDPTSLLIQWQDSVVSIWTQTSHASGFAVDAKGLIATSQRVLGTSTTAEVQLTPAVKVTGSVLAADAARDVALLRIDPKVLASVRPVPLACGQSAKPVTEGQELSAIGVPLRGPTSVASGIISHVDAHAIASDLILATGSAGGPVFSANGDLIGITAVADDRDEESRRASRVVRIDDVCEVIASAENKLNGARPPDGANLPVEPLQPFPMDALKTAVQRRAGALQPYKIPSSDFDVALITPVLIYGAQYQLEQANARDRQKGVRTAPVEPPFARELMDFGYWSEYFSDVPPVLLVRVTPKQVEGFWTTVARGAARTQGMNVPPIKHFKSGFARMRAFCGETEVTPIHPFKIEQRISDRDTISEGLYVFDPGALGPQCGTVKLVLYSEKEPEKGDTRVVDPSLIQQIWEDFTPYRTSRTSQ